MGILKYCHNVLKDSTVCVSVWYGNPPFNNNNFLFLCAENKYAMHSAKETDFWGSFRLTIIFQSVIIHSAIRFSKAL